jgi:hypothetical protein
MRNIKHNIHSKKNNMLTKIIIFILFTVFISFIAVSLFLFLLSKEIITLPDNFQNINLNKTLTKQNLSLQQTAKK